MKIVVILGHPNTESFNYAIAMAVTETLRNNGHQVIFHDLYRENFPPILTTPEISRDAALEPVIAKHCAEIAAAEGIVIIHPNWWGQPPAIVKGWVDRVFREGVAYEFAEGDSGEGESKGLLQAKFALVFNTSNTVPERELKVLGNPLETLWKNCIFSFCGVDNFYRKNFEVIATSTMKQRLEWLEEVRKTTGKHFPKTE